MNKFNLKDRVTVSSKNVSGKIAYIGETHFSEGEWFGIILDEAKGRNDGCIDGHCYFTCPRNHGIFVRPNQLEKEVCREESGKPAKTTMMCHTNNSCSSKPNRSHDTEKALNKIKNKKTIKQQMFLRNTTMKDLENTLKKQSKELSDIKKQKEEADENLKSMEAEFQKMTGELNKCSRVENDLSKNLATAQRDVAVLKRKLRNAERNLKLAEAERHKLYKVIEQLREITEAAVIEKEIAEEKSEQFEVLVQDEDHKCKTLKIEMEIMKEEMQLQCINGMPTKHFVKMLENRNKVLYSALQKLKDLYQGLQQQLREYKTTTENSFNEIRCLKEVENTKKQIISKCEEEVAELYNAINDMADADDIVCEVTEQNLELEETIKNLYRQLNSVEDDLEISEEMEETLSEIKSICTEEIEYLEAKYQRTRMALEQQVFVHKSNGEVINKYRELMTILRDRNRKLADELERVLKERTEAVVAAENLKLKMHQEKKKSLTDVVHVENMKYDMESFKEELNYWSPFMPEGFFVVGGENSAIQVKLIASKMIKKLGLIINLLKASYSKYDIRKNEDLKCLTTKTKFLIYASQLQSVLKIYDKSFDFTDTEHFLMLSKYHGILARKDEEIENYLSLICKDEIDTEDCLDGIRGTVCSLSQLLENKYAPKFRETMINSECYLSIILISCKYILFNCSAFEELDGISSDYKNNIKQITKVLTNIKMCCRTILNFAKNIEKENLYFCPIVEKRIKQDWQLINDATKCVISIYQFFCVENKTFSHDLEEVSLKEISCNMEQIEMDLEHLRKALSDGECLVEQVTAPQIASPICRWAQSKKQEAEERIRCFRNKIASCELEILDLSKSLHAKKKQDNQVVKGETLSDAGKQTKELLHVPLEAGDNSSVADYLRLKLQDMECSMKYLSQKNFELRVAPMKSYQDILTPLKVLRRPKYPPEIHDICILKTRLNKLSVDLRGIIVPLVVDICKKSSCKTRKFKKYLAERVHTLQEIDEELWLINIEIKKMRKSSRCIWSNTKPFSLRM